MSGVEMSFVRMVGVKGQVYVPKDVLGSFKKHECKDCASCLVCNDDKYAICLSQPSCNTRRNSKINKKRMTIYGDENENRAVPTRK